MTTPELIALITGIGTIITGAYVILRVKGKTDYRLTKLEEAMKERVHEETFEGYQELVKEKLDHIREIVDRIEKHLNGNN
jgi:hypothetical protein